MTLLDSIDSILMLYSYTGFPERSFRLFETTGINDALERRSAYQEAAATNVSRSDNRDANQHGCCAGVGSALTPQSGQNGVSEQDKKTEVEVVVEDAGENIRNIRKQVGRNVTAKRNVMSGLSIVLTLMSIIVAFR